MGTRVAMGVALAICATWLALSYQSQSTNAGMAIVVNSTDDEFNNDGDCALLEALSAAENDAPRDVCPAGSGADVIMIPEGVYPAGGFGINSQMTLEGAGPDTVLDGGGTSRPITLNSESANVTITDMTIRNGRAGLGGNIESHGTLLMERVVVQNGEAFSTAGGGIAIGPTGRTMIDDSMIEGNLARGGKGGSAIFNSGILIITDTTIRNNGDPDEGSSGGGITNSTEGDLTVRRSLIMENTTDLVNDDVLDYQGGGLMNEGVAVIENSTISGNTAGSGGGIFNRNTGHVELMNVTLAHNTLGSPAFGGDALANGEGLLEVRNTVVSSPSESVLATPASGTEVACVGEITSLGHNLESGISCTFTQPGDLQNVDPTLGPLQDNGGATHSHALLEGSPAIDAADNLACPDEDQRGEPRPQGGGCDIGAYESELTAPTPSPSPSPSPTPAPQEVTWGDHDCSESADPVDALLGLRFDAGLGTDTGDCPELGQQVDVQDYSAQMWGDADCSEAVDPVDSLKILRFDAGLSVETEPACPEIGDAVMLTQP